MFLGHSLLLVMAAFQRQFRNWDANGDGKLDYWEFSQLRGFKGHPPPNDQFLAHDTDSDGALNQHELVVALGLRQR
ncbi:hypothetical protein HOLleu_14825 [Holothuria leucospilota]|uniref:EF-hand domain-containing protein n=1 Tax=Holothuria leucospilota TaxID=206669 RepID=A0A9Q1C862_HOLLE|nr:hypothetical protein HOLleu_14825 [Holothuria leucospilota]